MAIAIVAMDIILLIIWFAASIYLVVKTGVAPCYDAEFIFHFLILIHFALGLTISNIVGEIEKEEYIHQEKRPANAVTPSTLQYLPYVIYSPFSWIFTSLIVLCGDITLFASAIRFYDIGASLGDECQPDRLARIFFDALALIISLVTVIWFILFAIYAIAPQRRQQMNTATEVRESSRKLMEEGVAGLRTRNIHQRQQFSNKLINTAHIYGVKK